MGLYFIQKFVQEKNWQTYSQILFNHVEILPIHEASRECVWLRSIVHHIQEDCGMYAGKKTPTNMYEDNAACITQRRIHQRR